MRGSLGEKINQGGTADIHAWAPGQVVKLFKEGFPPGLGQHEGLPAPSSPSPLAGEGGVAQRRRMRGRPRSPRKPATSENRLGHARGLLENLVVPETLNSESLGAQPCIASGVPRIFRVLRTVALDDQPMFERDEIGDEWTERNLASPFHCRQAPASQDMPKRPFRFRRRLAHRAGAGLGGYGNGMMRRRHGEPLIRRFAPPSPARGEGETPSAAP